MNNNQKCNKGIPRKGVVQRRYQPNPGKFGYQPTSKNAPPSPPKTDTNVSKPKP